MRPGYLRRSDRERYLYAVDEAREKVRRARREYDEALDELDELEDRIPESLFPPDEDYRARRRGRGAVRRLSRCLFARESGPGCS